MPRGPVPALVCVLLCASVILAENQAIGEQQTDGTAVGGGADTAELLPVLRESTGKAAAEALAALTRDANTTLANLPLLLPLAEQAKELMDKDLVQSEGKRGRWGLPFRTKGSLILARVADSIRDIADEAEHSRAFAELTSLTREALDPGVPGIPATHALEAYYRSVFYPPGIGVSPRECPAMEDVLTVLAGSLENDKPGVREKARMLLADAAFVLPGRREELLRSVEAKVAPEEAAQCRGWVEKWLEWDGAPMSHEAFVSMQDKNGEELLAYVLAPMHRRIDWRLHLEELFARLPTSPNRSEITLAILSDRTIAQRYPGTVMPGPIPESASQGEKDFTDTMIRFYQGKLAGPERNEWAASGLRRLILSDVSEAREAARSTGRTPPIPYACGRVIDALIEALGSQSRYVQQAAARELADVCWLGLEPAGAALRGLTALRDEIESTHDLSRPDDEFPGARHVHEEVVGAIHQVEQALAVFEGHPQGPAAQPQE